MSNWDRKTFNEAISSSKEAMQDIAENGKEYGPYRDLFTDVSLNEEHEMRESHLLNRSIMESALIAPEYK